MTKWQKSIETLKAETCDKILLEPFVANLDEETQKWVRYHWPVLAAKALQLAENFKSVQGVSPEWNLKAVPTPGLGKT